MVSEDILWRILGLCAYYGVASETVLHLGLGCLCPEQYLALDRWVTRDYEYFSSIFCDVNGLFTSRYCCGCHDC